MDLSVEYRPCSCSPYVRRTPSAADPRPVEDVGAGAPEFYEVETYAARRFVELVKRGQTPMVHVGDPGRSCLHIKAVTFQGERWPEDG